MYIVSLPSNAINRTITFVSSTVLWDKKRCTPCYSGRACKNVCQGVGVVQGCQSVMIPLMISSCHDVILFSFFLPKIEGTLLHSWVRSCTVGCAVAQFSITLVCNCMVISQFSTVYMVKSVQLHIFWCNNVLWHFDNLVPAPVCGHPYLSTLSLVCTTNTCSWYPFLINNKY